MLASQGRDEKKEERAYQRRDEARQGEREMVRVVILYVQIALVPPATLERLLIYKLCTSVNSPRKRTSTNSNFLSGTTVTILLPLS